MAKVENVKTGAVALNKRDLESIRDYANILQEQLKNFVRDVAQSDAHDVHLLEGSKPHFRVGGKLTNRLNLSEWGLGLFHFLLRTTQSIDKTIIFVPEYDKNVQDRFVYKKMYKRQTNDGKEVQYGPVLGKVIRQVKEISKNEDGKNVLTTYYEEIDFKKEILGEKMSHDISVSLKDKILRCHFFLSQPELLTCAIRVAPKEVPDFTSLNLPLGMDKVIHKSRGLVLVSGGVGVGKTTTVNSLIKVLNEQSTGPGKDRGIIITVEDPVEFIHDEGFYKIIQRQVGVDTPSFSQASSDALRENADIVFLGELRTWEEMNNALQIAETNHLVISTIHSNGVVDTIERFVSSAPPDIQDTVRSRLNENLLGIIHQELIASPKTGKRVPLVSQLIISNDEERDKLRGATTRNEVYKLFSSTGENKAFELALTREEGKEHLVSLNLIDKGDIKI